MKKKMMLCGLIVMVFLLAVSQFVFASLSWTDAKRYDVIPWTDWKTKAADGQKMGANKTTDKGKYEVHTIGKTMWSSPVLRLVNSNDKRVSDEIQAAPSGRTNTGKTNTAQIGYAYYLSIRPGWNQMGEGSIKLQMKNY